MITYGIDVSTWQTLNDEDFEKLAEKGVRFVVARASHGKEEDGSYVKHMRLAKKHGMVFGAYHFMTEDVLPAVQADVFWEVARPRADFYVLDAEVNGLTNYDLAAFKAAWEGPERTLGLYTRESLLNKWGKAAQLYDWWWLAKWPEAFNPTWLAMLPVEEELKEHAPLEPFWQYTDRLNFRSPDGKERVMGDVFMGTETEFLQYIGLLTY